MGEGEGLSEMERALVHGKRRGYERNEGTETARKSMRGERQAEGEVGRKH